MDKQEAIDELNLHLEHWQRLLAEHICTKEEGTKTIKALETAIQALQTEQNAYKEGFEVCRQAVLDAIDEFYKYSGRSAGLNAEYIDGKEYAYNKVKDMVKFMQPVMPARDINVSTTDAISRQDVIIWYCNKTCGLDYCTEPCMDIKELWEFSSINPQKVGKWVKISPAGIYECSLCGKNVMTSDICAYGYCHGCGVKMQEGE